MFDKLKDGIYLCDLLNKIKPNTCNNIHRYNMNKNNILEDWEKRTNITIFINGCKALNIPETRIISTNDLFESKSLNGVIINIYAVSDISKNYGYKGNKIRSKHSKSSSNISQEITIKTKGSTPLMIPKTHMHMHVPSNSDNLPST